MADLTPQQQVDYDRMRAKGVGRNLAYIMASQTAPGMDRTDERWRGSDDRREHGNRAPRGKYQPGIARYPGDPAAFVQSRGEARDRAEQFGLDIIDPADIYDDLNDPESNGEWPEEFEYGDPGLF